MASRIQILPPEIANLIAAGEVVERPASVVKELIENALDADAREIHVAIAGGGARRIAVRDDGDGMTPEEARLSLQRHATSKIHSAADLAAVRTLGFRGEALPSIAAVSRLQVTTKPRGSGAVPGVQIGVAGGVVERTEEVGCPDGTEVVVADLFYHTPARRKFLKGERTEYAHIQDVVERFALAYPTVRFRLTHEGRTMRKPIRRVMCMPA